ncbi:replication initiation protein [Campylobacter cuniculorum]|uniref:Replication protein n=2 Tax=Campylobacter cuniculorum TaxID=374106 RepID=A0A1W6BYD4_9BACT|nr:replication initiation protein [Campylobacter cuniculorum]ARJ57098.1 replication protein [Campylobacter cuniculorum DSM 23162 = LMG 24588]QOR04543.1 replication initiation protein [Campylobacter cuniculorum]
MSFAQFVTFDFVEGNYTLKFTQRSQNKLIDTSFSCSNEINSIIFPNFTAMDFNIFFTICYFVSKHIKENGGIKTIKRNKIDVDIKDEYTHDFIEVSYSDLKIFLPQIKNKKRFYKQIYEFSNYKLSNLVLNHIKYKDIKEFNDEGKGEIKIFQFFDVIIVDNFKEILKLKINPYAYFILSKFNNFMSFDMNEFCSFENKYTKTLFRLLKQYENGVSETGADNLNKKSIYMNKDEFQKFIDNSNNYNYNVYDLEKKTIKPSIKELNLGSYSFKNVDYERIYADNKNTKMRKVKGFRFIFEKRND